jgi:TRAP-type C4-dicarboxylate transport system substrate-binding protein
MTRLRAAALIAAFAALLPPAADAADPIQLKLAYPSAPSPPLFAGMRPFAEQVAKATDGAVEIKIFVGPTLGNLSNIYDRTLAGVADMAYGTIVVGGMMPKTTVSNLPFNSSNSHEASLALWRLQAKGVTASDFGAVKPLALFTFGSSVLHTTKPIRTIEDYKGEKIGAPTKNYAETLVLFGAAPVTITPTEYYQSISQGLVVGVPVSWTGLMAFKLFEVTNHHLETPQGLAPAYFVMNKQSFARLPEKARQAIDKFSGEGLSARIGKAGNENDLKNREKIAGTAGHTITALTSQETARWRKVLTPVTDGWVKATPDGARVLAAFRDEVLKARRELR